MAAFFVFVGGAYIIFGKISSEAYAARPFDANDPPRSRARYFWNVYRELYPKSILPSACAACAVVAAMTLVAATISYVR